MYLKNNLSDYNELKYVLLLFISHPKHPSTLVDFTTSISLKPHQTLISFCKHFMDTFKHYFIENMSNIARKNYLKSRIFTFSDT